MAAGKEIKRLRGSLTALQAAALIGVDAERLRKWEQRDANPKDSGDIRAVEDFFGCSLEDLSRLERVQWTERPKTALPAGDNDPYKDKYISLLEKQLAEKEAEIKDLHNSLESSYLQLNKHVAINRSYLKAVYRFLQEHRAKVEKLELHKVQQEMDKILAGFIREELENTTSVAVPGKVF